MRKIIFLLVCLISLQSLFCQTGNNITTSTPPVSPGYNFSSPEKVYILPAILHEISGITAVSNSILACVQDEHGVVFFHDTNANKIARQLYFSYEGDYEGITSVNNTLYILRSDGVVFEVTDFSSDKFRKSIYVTGVPGAENEGLCYDRRKNILLIGPKFFYSKKDGEKGKRYVYGFDPVSKKLLNKPVLIIDLDEIRKFADDNNLRVPVKGKKGGKKEPDIEFRISAIGVHPLTNKYFIISGSERLLFVFNSDGMIEYIEWLDPEIYNQPEGITFLSNGDMFISNEGQKKSATLVRLKYEP